MMGLEDEIAIVGAGCRFPGADNLDEFWEVLINGENHVKEIPATRWNNSAFYDEDQNASGKIYVNKAGLLKNHDKWDNRLFGISEVEACRVDPQQRYVLECVHMALEDGGITRKQINGTNTGVIIGSMNDDYKVMANSDLTELGGYTATGSASSVLAARVSYVYNLHGTCLTLDTACSSALIAIHLASQAIRTGDCDMMICGGVSSILSPDTFKALCEARMLSTVGQCQSFCETADGYARGEGCGVVILKRLKAVIEDGNKIWATIKTGSSQDGATARPMTAPSADQQLELLKHVYETFHFNATDIQYIEAHGTGIPRGDPTEINALGTFFSSERSKQSTPLLFGSVKSNIGHTESAAGVAGLLKVLLMMKHGKYVPSLHVKPDKSNVNKAIKLSEYNLDVSTSVQDFPFNKNGERHACLNSFGFGGSNAHALIATKDMYFSKNNETVQKHIIPICISAVNHEALRQNLIQFKADIQDSIETQENIAYTSFYHRDMFSFRTLVFGCDVTESQEECNHRIERCTDMLPKKKHNKVFVFCGVGTTWNGMCQKLMKENEVFRKTVDQIDVYLESLTKWKMGDRFLVDTNYEDPFLNHVAIFCVQVALTEVWKSFGIIPDVIVGQSVGEVAAAYAANLLSLEDAVKVIYFRSEILARQSGGSMTVVGNMNTKEIENMCSKYEDKVCITVYSSPVACTLSGSTDELKDLTNGLKADGTDTRIFIRELKVKCAYHSSLLDGCVDEIKRMLDPVFNKSTSSLTKKDGEFIPMISTVTGEPATFDQINSGTYWATNIRQPVRFMQSIEEAFDMNNFNVYLEIGPRPVLRAHLSNILGSTIKARAVPSMLPNKEIQCLYRSLSEMFELGININDSSFIDREDSQLCNIPRYSFNRTAELFMPKTTQDYLAGYTIDNSHMFIRSAKSADDMRFEINIDIKSTPFVFDHFLSEKVIVPGATYIETGFKVGMEMFEKPVDRLSVSFSFAKTFSPSSSRKNTLSVKLTSRDEKHVQFSVLNEGNTLACGVVSERSIPRRKAVDIRSLKAECTVPKTKSECYASLENFNFRYGDSLSLIQNAFVSESEQKCLTELCIPDFLCKELTRTHFHPAIIDSVFQIFGILIESSEDTFTNAFVVPKGVGGVVVNKPVEPVMYGFGEQIRATDNSTHYNAVLLSKDGSVIAEFEDFYTSIIRSDTDIHDKSYKYALKWSDVKELPSTNTDKSPKHVLLFSDDKDSKWLKDLKAYVDVLTESTIETLSIHLSNQNTKMMIIYHVSGDFDNGMEANAQKVFLNAITRFSNIMKLLAEMKKTDLDIQITIITENTQACPGRETMTFNGSEIWGMVRSATLEGGTKSVKLIDIDRDNVDVKSLMNLLSNSDTNDIEFALSGTQLFQPKMQTYIAQKRTKRAVMVTSSDKLAIYSGNPIAVNDPYLLLSNQPKASPKTVQVTIESLITNSNGLYSQTLLNMDVSESMLHTHGETDFQVIALEGRGKTEKGNDVVFLFPVRAATIVDLPMDCVINTIDCPFQSNGILILINVLIQIASEVQEATDVTVIKQSEEQDVGQELFTSMLLTKNCTVQFLMDKQIPNADAINNQVLVVTCYLSAKRWMMVLKAFPELRRIVSLSRFFPEQFPLWMKHTYPDIQLIILSTSDMLSINKISITMPMVKKVLRQFRSYSGSRETNKFLLDLPMNNLQIEDKIVDGSLKCFCNATSLFRSQACYMIVGGLTGLGWVLLQLLAEKGAGMLVTLSRRHPSNSIQEELDNLQKSRSCRIVPMQSDITDLDSVQRTFSDIQQKFPSHPIKGIFHGAGVLSDALLENMDEQKVKTVLKPKINGAWNLHIASFNCPLDYFVLHSSIVSVIGNPGQCNYAAANSFIDSFALYRRSKGLPAQSINWGALAVGMAVDSNAIESQLKRSGFSMLTQKQIKEFFLEAMLNDDTGVIYADIEWERLLAVQPMSTKSSKYSQFRSKRINVVHTNKIHFEMEEYTNLMKDEQIRKIQDVLTELVHEQLVIDEDALKIDRPITTLGIDSMVAMALSNKIDQVFKCRISLVVLLSEETRLSTLSDFIWQNIGTSSHESGDQDSSDTNSLTSRLFNTDGYTFMQLDFLDKYKYHRNDPYYLRVIDVELTETKLHLEDWHVLLRHVLKINPELRKVFHFAEKGEVSFETVGYNDLSIDITMFSYGVLEDKNSPDIRLQLPTDLNGRLPVSFRIHETEVSTVLRVITHALVVDMRGLSLLCRDIEATIVAYFYKKDLPERTAIDVPETVKAYILPRMNELQRFWKNYLDCNIKPITLGSRLHCVEEKYCSIEHLTVPQGTVLAIKKFLARFGITLYEFIMSLYQIYLFIGSNSPVITVGTAADMRFHVPGLSHVITRCVNYLPIIAELNDETTIEDFVRSNSKQLSTATQHGAYPYSLIRNELKTDEVRDNLSRHFLAMNDMEEINKVMEDKNSRASIRRVWHMRHDRETFIFVRYDLQKAWIKLEIGQNTKICGQYGQMFSDNMMLLAEAVMSNGHKTLSALRSELTGNLKEGNTLVKHGNSSTNGSKEPQLNRSSDLIKALPNEVSGKTQLVVYADNLNVNRTKSVMIPPNKSEGSKQKSHVENKHMKNIMKQNNVNTLKADISKKNTFDVKELSSPSIKSKTPENKDIMNGQQQNIQNDPNEIVLASGEFEKQTSHGWDHKVQVRLCEIDGKAVLEWGKEKRMRKNKPRVVQLADLREVIMQDINGLPSLIIDTGKKLLVLKTPSRYQAGHFLDVILGSTKIAPSNI